MYSTLNESKSVVPERFIKTSRNKIYKQMTGIIKDVHIEKLNDIVYKISYTYHRKIKMKPVNFKDSAYFGDSVKSNNKILNLKLVIV